MRRIKSCKNCKNRYSGCHDACPAYLADFLVETELHEKIFKEKGIALDADNFAIEQAIKKRR